MNELRRFLAAFALTLVLSIAALAGEMQTPGRNDPPPPPSGDSRQMQPVIVEHEIWNSDFLLFVGQLLHLTF
jgi:hypothetical protein